ncbi:MAG: carotenoid biosynthesis protein [Thermodesulfobacteriota bacterium]
MNTQFQALVFVFTAAIFLHAFLTLSVSNAFRLFFLAFLLSYFAEYISMHYICLFGKPYHYDPALYPILPGGVPIIVVFMWFILAYTALKFLYAIPIRSKGSYSLWRILLKGGLSALYIMATDFFIDPLGIFAGLWVWHGPGGYFGIPWANFAGWFLVSFVIFFLYLITEKAFSPTRIKTDYFLDKAFVVVTIFPTIFCITGCVIYLGNVGPIFLSLIVMGPVWIYWAISLQEVQRK